MPKRHLEGSTQESRAKARKEMGTLKNLTVQPLTKARYQQSLEQLFSYLKNEQLLLPKTAGELDPILSDYLEYLWAKGHGRSAASNVLAAIQDSQPQMRGRLPQSWRLLKAWVTNEIPNRAPPLPKEVLFAMVGYACFKGWHHMAITLLLGYYGLLRTGELLQVKVSHVAVESPRGPAVISLGLTKSGKRQGAAESVAIHDEDLCRRLHQWIQVYPATSTIAGPAHKWRQTFSDILKALEFHKWDFRPYSLRRGGATAIFKNEGSLDRLMILGRWQSARTARVYLNEGLAVLAELSLPWTRFSRNFQAQYLASLQKPLPKLEHTAAKQRQGRGTRRKKHS